MHTTHTHTHTHTHTRVHMHTIQHLVYNIDGLQYAIIIIITVKSNTCGGLSIYTTHVAACDLTVSFFSQVATQKTTISNSRCMLSIVTVVFDTWLSLVFIFELNCRLKE